MAKYMILTRLAQHSGNLQDHGLEAGHRLNAQHRHVQILRFLAMCYILSDYDSVSEIDE